MVSRVPKNRIRTATSTSQWIPARPHRLLELLQLNAATLQVLQVQSSVLGQEGLVRHTATGRCHCYEVLKVFIGCPKSQRVLRCSESSCFCPRASERRVLQKKELPTYLTSAHLTSTHHLHILRLLILRLLTLHIHILRLLILHLHILRLLILRLLILHLHILRLLILHLRILRLLIFRLLILHLHILPLLILHLHILRIFTSAHLTISYVCSSCIFTSNVRSSYI